MGNSFLHDVSATDITAMPIADKNEMPTPSNKNMWSIGFKSNSYKSRSFIAPIVGVQEQISERYQAENTDKVTPLPVVDPDAHKNDVVSTFDPTGHKESDTSSDCTGTTNAEARKRMRYIKKDLVLSLVDAYVEIHKLVFQNFYGKFCQTPAYLKALKKAKKAA